MPALKNQEVWDPQKTNQLQMDLFLTTVPRSRTLGASSPDGKCCGKPFGKLSWFPWSFISSLLLGSGSVILSNMCRFSVAHSEVSSGKYILMRNIIANKSKS